MKMNEKVSSKPCPWYKTTAACWVRDSAIVLSIFWAVSSWQTKDMLDTDGSIHVEPMVLKGLDGQEYSYFVADKPSKPTLIYFFAPWCHICQMSMGNLNGIDLEKVNVVKIALDFNSTDSVEEFVEGTRVAGPILLGNSEIKHRFQVPGYPSYYLLDENNTVVGRSMGYSTEWGMELKRYLASQS